MVSDEELVTRTAQRDEDAFLALYDQYSPRVYGLALRMVRDIQMAEEITQDVFLKLWTRSRSYLAMRGAFAPWLLTITRNTALDRLRLENRRPSVADEHDPEETWEFIASEEMPQDEARWRSLYFAVLELPKEQRQAIELAYYHGMSHGEIAAHLGWPVGTVKTRIRIGMDQLRQQWLEGQTEEAKSNNAPPDVLQ
jgi:RNA polymerase sigma-70 factor (ECF subfamily)